MDRPAIFRLGSPLRLPWMSLGAGPPVFRPTHRRGLWVLDEGLTGDLYGGNKVRKLEFLLADAQERGAASLVTMGAAGSHHVLATARYAARLGLRTHAALVPQPYTPHAHHNLRHIVASCDHIESTPFPAVGLPLALARLAAHAPDAVWVPLGGTGPLGVVGWASVGLEIAEAMADGRLPTLRQVVVALGSGGTAAGLLLGLRLARCTLEVVGVRVVDRPLGSARLTRLQAHRGLLCLRAAGAAVPASLPLEGFRVDGSWLAGGYGHASPQTHAAVAEGQAALGVPLEQTYTAKALGAAMTAVASGNGPVLYVHTLNHHPLPPLPDDPLPLPPPLASLLVRGST